MKDQFHEKGRCIFWVIPSNMYNPVRFAEKCDGCEGLTMKIIRLLLPFLGHTGYRISFANIFSYGFTCRLCFRIYKASDWISKFSQFCCIISRIDISYNKNILNLHYWLAHFSLNINILPYSITFIIFHHIICKERDRILQLRFLGCVLKFTSEVIKKREKKEWFYEENFSKNWRPY